MICAHPFYRVSPTGGHTKYLAVGCGRCAPCRAARASDWANRMLWESDYHDQSCFITLTFSEESLLERGTLSVAKSDLQLFFKRVRRLSGRRLKYFSCGEYGERSGRAHYHAIVFGLGVEDQELVSDCWSFGRISVSSFAVSRARYTADYLLKEVDGSISLLGREPPFALMSQGIGKQFAVDNFHRVFRPGRGVTVNGELVRIPRFLRSVLHLKPDLGFLRDSVALHDSRIDSVYGDVDLGRRRGFREISFDSSRFAAAEGFVAERGLRKAGRDGFDGL
ncbi:MAG: replication initiator protein [Microvirus sp.]|nr:MAG: replication initiator protein [Microvirus sp.]